MSKDLTILMAVNSQLSKFQHVITSYYACFQGYRRLPKLVISPGSNVNVEEIQEYLHGQKIPHKILDSNDSFIRAIVELIDSVKTPYFMFMLDDVCVCKTKDFFTPIKQAFKKNKQLIQVKFGGGAVTDGERNIDNIYVEGGVANLRHAPNLKFHPYITKSQDTVWIGSLNHQHIQNIYAISQWNAVMRTSVFKDIHSVIKSRISGSDSTWSDYLALINYSGGIRNHVQERGWPQGLEFLDNCQTGWLNFCSYIYAHGRQNQNLQTFVQTHTEEIK